MTFAKLIGSSADSNSIIGIISGAVMPAILALAGLYFAYGIVKYFFLEANNDESRVQGRQFALWGVLALAALFSVWGFVNIVINTLGIGS